MRASTLWKAAPVQAFNFLLRCMAPGTSQQLPGQQSLALESVDEIVSHCPHSGSLTWKRAK